MHKTLILLTAAMLMMSFLHCKRTDNADNKEDIHINPHKTAIVWKGEPVKLAPGGCYA